MGIPQEMEERQWTDTVFSPVPDKDLFDDDFQIFG